MTATDKRVSNLSIQRQIGALDMRLSQLCQDIGEIKTMLKNIEERVRALENAEAGAHPLMESRIDAAWRKLEEHDKQIDLLSSSLLKLEQSNRLLSWLGGILGSTVIVWLVMQILGLVK